MCFRSCYISRQIEELMTWLIGSNSLGRKKFESELWKGAGGGVQAPWGEEKGKGIEQRGELTLS